VSATVTIPGFVNAHSHTFQRALRGSHATGDFWHWRDGMLELADRQTPELVRDTYLQTYREMLAAGYTAVGEFHYIGVDEARAAAAAAEEAEIVFVLLLSAYERGGLPRFRHESVDAYLEAVETLQREGIRIGLAPHSVRACSRAWLEEIGRYAADSGLVLHVHADEQPREIEECLAEHGIRPIELLAATGCLGPRTTVVHATHATERELDLLAETGTTICLCPSTEANLGDGFFPALALRDREIGICIGSDSNVRLDPFEELREIEWVARRQERRRGIFRPETLLEFGSTHGAAALRLDDVAVIEVEIADAASLVFSSGPESVR